MKKFLAMVMALCMIFALCAVSASADDHEPLTLEFSQSATDIEHHGKCWATFADYVHEKCPWITINIHYAGELYKDDTFCDAIMRGNVNMGVTAPGYIGEYAPELAIFAAPYIFDNIDQMNAVLNGDMGHEIYEKVAADTGVRLLGAVYQGSRIINLREDKRVGCRDDLKGVLMRVPTGESWMNMGYALGCEPTSMALSEVYLAMQAGTVDGQDNPLKGTMNYNFGEVTKSISLTNHLIAVVFPAIQEEIWQTFDDETKQVFYDAFQIAYDEDLNAYVSEEDGLVEEFRKQGLTVYDDIDTAAFGKEVWEYIWANNDKFGYDKDMYEAIKAAG